MKKIGGIDVGGTSIKYGVWNGAALEDKGSIPTPKTLEEFYERLTEIVETMKEKHAIIGVGMSLPGAVNKEKGLIDGASALPYIHHFPILEEFVNRFGLPVSFENDANCAALAEVKYGAGKDVNNILFFILGTGVGGSLIFDGKVHHGKHLFGGEFGFMLMKDGKSLSQLGTTVQMAKRYEKRVNDGKHYTGEEVFELAFNGDAIAQEEAETFFYNVALGIFNLSYAFDPDRVIIGGGVSHAPFLLPEIDKRLDKIIKGTAIASWKPEIAVCEFMGDANLIGAVADFLSENE